MPITLDDKVKKMGVICTPFTSRKTETNNKQRDKKSREKILELFVTFSVRKKQNEKIFKSIFEMHKRNTDHQCTGRKRQNKVYRHMDG